MLRAQDIPARARCGFGGYFGTGWFEDHWVCEYWNAAAGRWVLADTQIDDVQRKMFGLAFNVLDTSREDFLVAGDAWARCRAGEADPARFGLSFMNEGGYWWIAANLIRDVAALNNMEMLPWDVWGAMPRPGERRLTNVDPGRLAIARAVADIADGLGLSSSVVALAWLRAQGSVIPILGARTAQQLADNLTCLDVNLPPDALARLDQASHITRGFPHDFLASADFILGGMFGQLDLPPGRSAHG